MQVRAQRGRIVDRNKTISRYIQDHFAILGLTPMQYALSGTKPTLIGGGHFIAPSASVIGNVILHPNASIWFNVVARGDNDPINIGEGSNVQDLSCMHTDIGAPLTIGKFCVIGHQVMLHGCTIGDGTLIGMQAVVLNRAVIGRECIIGAGALITEGKVIPDRSLVVGSPGKVIRTLTDEDVANIRKGAQGYVQNAARFAAGLTAI
jgi:carbonic anhydrase/acetyltransferase-like protein (isoleucine patch superfamily)